MVELDLSSSWRTCAVCCGPVRACCRGCRSCRGQGLPVGRLVLFREPNASPSAVRTFHDTSSDVAEQVSRGKGGSISSRPPPLQTPSPLQVLPLQMPSPPLPPSPPPSQPEQPLCSPSPRPPAPPPCHARSGLGRERHGDAIHAIAQARGRGPVLKYMPEVPPTHTTHHLLLAEQHIRHAGAGAHPPVGERTEEGWPAGARVKLAVRRVQGCAAACTRKGAGSVLLVQRGAPGALRCGRAEDRIGGGAQARTPTRKVKGRRVTRMHSRPNQRQTQTRGATNDSNS